MQSRLVVKRYPWGDVTVGGEPVDNVIQLNCVVAEWWDEDAWDLHAAIEAKHENEVLINEQVRMKLAELIEAAEMAIEYEGGWMCGIRREIISDILKLKHSGYETVWYEANC